MRGKSEIGWIHPKSDGSITLTYVFFCVLLSWETLHLSVCFQISVDTDTGGCMMVGELEENLVEWAEEERKSLFIC